MSEVFETASLEWRPIRPDVAHGVYGKTLLAEGVKLVLTSVEPGGKFAAHRDDYSHLFYFLEGEGAVCVEDNQHQARPGLVVRVSAGEAHAYENTGSQDLLLISANLPTR
jgi:quercetin dioxygenase-like cupin family protein